MANSIHDDDSDATFDQVDLLDYYFDDDSSLEDENAWNSTLFSPASILFMGSCGWWFEWIFGQ